jgi:hypothetical protein
LWEGRCHRLNGLDRAAFWEVPAKFNPVPNRFLRDVDAGRAALRHPKDPSDEQGSTDCRLEAHLRSELIALQHTIGAVTMGASLHLLHSSYEPADDLLDRMLRLLNASPKDEFAVDVPVLLGSVDQ